MKSSNPKDFWKFFSGLGEKAAFLSTSGRALQAQETDDASEPPGSVLDVKVHRADWIVFLQVLVALHSGRPVKIIPHSPTMYRVFVGPKT